MPAMFEESGLRFRYPENWEMTREENPNGWTVALQSPETAFMLVTFDGDMPEADLMAETALEAMGNEYEGLESEPRAESLAGVPAVGHDMRFFSFDLTNTCWTRSFYCGDGTVLVLWQANDLELERLEPVIQAIIRSFEVEE